MSGHNTCTHSDNLSTILYIDIIVVEVLTAIVCTIDHARWAGQVILDSEPVLYKLSLVETSHGVDHIAAYHKNYHIGLETVMISSISLLIILGHGFNC